MKIIKRFGGDYYVLVGYHVPDFFDGVLIFCKRNKNLQKQNNVSTEQNIPLLCIIDITDSRASRNGSRENV